MILMPINSWSAYKTTIITNKGLLLQYTETPDRYELFAAEQGVFVWTYSILRDGGADVLDFEANYKTAANAKLNDVRDSENAPIQRLKMAPSGWTYQLRGVAFETSKLSSIENNDESGVDCGGVTLSFYKTVNDAYVQITGDDLNQTFLDANCTKTVIDFEPTYDYEIIGGFVKSAEVCADNTCLDIIAVPDIPYVYGGSRVMVRNLNLKFLGAGDRVEADGRVAKRMTYSSVYHSNKLRFSIRHTVGFKAKLLISVEHYKA